MNEDRGINQNAAPEPKDSGIQLPPADLVVDTQDLDTPMPETGWEPPGFR